MESNKNTYYETLEGFKELFINKEERKEKYNQNHINELIELGKEIDEDDKNFVDNVFELMKKTRIFKLDEDLVNVFLNTDSEMEYIHLPFKNIFLDRLWHY